MATAAIDLRIDGARQAASGVREVSDSIGALTEKMNALSRAGDYAGAADISRQIDNMQRNIIPFPAGAGGSGGNGGGFFGGGNGSANASKLDMRLELLNKTIEELTSQLEEATESGRNRDAYNLSATLNNVEQERTRLEAEKKRNESTPESGAENAIKKYGLSRYFTQGLGYAQQAFGIGYNYRTAMANGDYLGAPVGTVESVSNMAQGVGGSVLGAGLMMGWNPVGWGLMAAGGLLEIGGAVGNIFAGNERADIAEQSAYERSLVHTGALNRRFANGGSWKDNANREMDILEKATAYAEGTNLSAYELADLATQMSSYGVGSTDAALKQASAVAMRSNNTGADSGTIAALLGTSLRYGATGDVLGYASQARQAAGMTKAQDQEFLQALQGVIEEGIADGYVKSVEDVSNTMVMFARLSDNNPMWQGQQGANRLRQMNAGIAGATELQSVSNLIVASAAHSLLEGKNIDDRNKMLKGRASGTYIDDMLLMEQGNNPEMFGAIARNIMDMEGGNYAASIERVKDVFGVNYGGAVDIYSMMNKIGKDGYTEEDFKKQVEAMQKDEQYISDETKRKDAIIRLDDNVNHIVQSKFWEGTAQLYRLLEQRLRSQRQTAPAAQVTNAVNAAASSPATAEAANRVVAESGYRYDNTGNAGVDARRNSSVAATALNIANDQLGAVNAFMGLDRIKNAISETHQLNNNNLYTSFAARLAGLGNDDFKVDESKNIILRETLADYAANASKRGGLFGIGARTADGKVDEAEVFEALNRLEYDRNVKNLYQNGSDEDFKNAIIQAFKELFGEITITTQ